MEIYVNFLCFISNKLCNEFYNKVIGYKINYKLKKIGTILKTYIYTIKIIQFYFVLIFKRKVILIELIFICKNL